MDTVTFTDRVIANNFDDIARALTAATKVVGNHASRIALLEDRVDELTQVVFSTTKHMVEVTAKAPKKNSKLLVLTVVGGAAYFGYQYAQAEFAKKDKQSVTAESLRNKQAANTTSPPSENGDNKQS